MTKRVVWFTGEPSVKDCFTPNKVYEVVREEATNFSVINDKGVQNFCLKKCCAHICHKDWVFADVIEEEKVETLKRIGVVDDVIVKVKFSDGTTYKEEAGNWSWFKQKSDGDSSVRFYKVKLKDKEKPKSKWTKNTGVNPLNTDACVKIVRRDSGKGVMKARYCDWSLSGHSYDIIKWRLAD